MKVTDPEMQSFIKTNCIFLCHRHVLGQPGGWVDVYYPKKGCVIAIAPEHIQLIRRGR